jgi:hypothetical protein
VKQERTKKEAETGSRGSRKRTEQGVDGAGVDKAISRKQELEEAEISRSKKQEASTR